MIEQSADTEPSNYPGVRRNASGCCKVMSARGDEYSMPESPKETPSERLTRYRRLAAEMDDLAAKSPTDDLRQMYVTLGAGWTSLAQDLQTAIGRGKR